jgi:hypothetical protein
VARRRDGALIGVTGSSRSGKTEHTRRCVDAAPRLLVWDFPKFEWSTDRKFRCHAVTSAAELRELVKEGTPARRIAYAPRTRYPREHFQFWSECAWTYARAHGGPIVAEELSVVTQSNWAPPAWENLCRMALGYGSDIYALTQRPAQTDKASIGNASRFHAGLQSFPRDQRTMAEYLGVPLAEFARLRQFEWFERDLRTGKVTRSKPISAVRKGG